MFFSFLGTLRDTGTIFMCTVCHLLQVHFQHFGQNALLSLKAIMRWSGPHHESQSKLWPLGESVQFASVSRYIYLKNNIHKLKYKNVFKNDFEILLYFQCLI